MEKAPGAVSAISRSPSSYSKIVLFRCRFPLHPRHVAAVLVLLFTTALRYKGFSTFAEVLVVVLRGLRNPLLRLNLLLRIAEFLLLS